MRSSIDCSRAEPTALALPRRLGAQRGQVPVRLLGVEAVHLEQQPQGPVGVGADQKGRRRQQLESSCSPFLARSGGPHRAAPLPSSVVYTWPWGRYWRRSWEVKKAWRPRRRRRRSPANMKLATGSSAKDRTSMATSAGTSAAARPGVPPGAPAPGCSPGRW